jgi:hypothetical protein
MIRPVGKGVICGATLGPLSETIASTRQPIISAAAETGFRRARSRHSMPGYHHLVPPGQTHLRLMLTRMGSRRTMAGRTSASSVEPLQIDANKNPDPDASALHEMLEATLLRFALIRTRAIATPSAKFEPCRTPPQPVAEIVKPF